MQKISLEAQSLTLGDNQTPAEPVRQSVNALATLPFLGIDLILVGATGYTGVVESLADRQKIEKIEKKRKQSNGN